MLISWVNRLSPKARRAASSLEVKHFVVDLTLSSPVLSTVCFSYCSIEYYSIESCQRDCSITLAKLYLTGFVHRRRRNYVLVFYSFDVCQLYIYTCLSVRILSDIFLKVSFSFYL